MAVLNKFYVVDSWILRFISLLLLLFSHLLALPLIDWKREILYISTCLLIEIVKIYIWVWWEIWRKLLAANVYCKLKFCRHVQLRKNLFFMCLVFNKIIVLQELLMIRRVVLLTTKSKGVFQNICNIIFLFRK